MSCDTYYQAAVDPGSISPPLEDEEVEQVNAKILSDRWPWGVTADRITTPPDPFRQDYDGEESDASTLAFIVETILSIRPDVEVEGVFYMTYSDDDSMDRLEILDGKVYSSYRNFSFTENELEEPWKE